MLFSRSVIVAALMGFAAAKSGNGNEGGGGGKNRTSSVIASESLLASATGSATSLSTGSSASSSEAGTVNTHIIQVGGPNGTLTFLPNNVKAQPGDLVQFQFHPKNHSVVQSTFDNPCVPIQNIMPNKTDAFFSGYMPTNASFTAKNQVLTYTIRVKDTKPVWFYCSQAKHCQTGMVGAINAPATGNKTMEAFTALAAKAPENLSPGQTTGTGGSAGNTPTSPSAGGGANSESGTGSGSGTGAGTSAGSGSGSASSNGSASATSSGGLAQATANTASGLISQSVFGLGAAAMAAFVML